MGSLFEKIWRLVAEGSTKLGLEAGLIAVVVLFLVTLTRRRKKGKEKSAVEEALTGRSWGSFTKLTEWCGAMITILIIFVWINHPGSNTSLLSVVFVGVLVLCAGILSW